MFGAVLLTFVVQFLGPYTTQPNGPTDIVDFGVAVNMQGPGNTEAGVVPCDKGEYVLPSEQVQ